MKPIIQSGLARHKELPDVPLMQEVIFDPIGQKVAEFMSAGSAIKRALIVPPGVPADRIAALLNAWTNSPKIPSSAASRGSGRGVDPKAGIETQSISNAIPATPPDVIKSVSAISK